LSQEIEQYSVHQSQKEYFDSLAIYSPEEFINYIKVDEIVQKNNYKDCKLEKIVFGWHPYWSGNSFYNYRWNMLSDLSYFSYEVDYLTGDSITTHDWLTTAVIDSAQANNVRVNLCVTLFDKHADFFDNSEAQQKLIDNLLTLVQNRNANGVNIDFELVPESEAVKFNSFLVNLADQFHEEISNSQVSIALHAVDWYNIYNIDVLKEHIDLFIIMAYDYYWPSSEIAGPSGQLYMMNSFNYTISRSIIDYLNAGVPNEKLVCGVPYYGYEWETSSSNIPATTTNKGVSRTIKLIKNNSSGYYSERKLDQNSMCAYYNYYSGGTWHQAWVDDENSLKYKYDVILQQDIAGIGIWALGYDDGYTEMWDLIENTFSTCAEIPCSYNIYDMGGPTREHYNREDYIFTIAPTNYTDYLSLNFLSFELEAGFDSLWIYDGKNIDATLIGGYSGTASPNLIEASGGAITVKFYSDGATVKSGWDAQWSCSPAYIANIKDIDLQIYPNPAYNFINIKSDNTPSIITIYSTEGKLIKRIQNKKIINISNVNNGMYFIKINFGNSLFTKKIIIRDIQ